MNLVLLIPLYLPSPQQKLGSPGAFRLADMIQGMPAFAGMTAKESANDGRRCSGTLIRHPGESRDPTIRVTKSSRCVPVVAWIPAFAGMTNLIGMRNDR